MCTTMPIKEMDFLKRMKDYYREEKINPRNYLLIITGINTALRISDILALKWEDVYSFSRKTYREHISLREHKTKKCNMVKINSALIDALDYYSVYYPVKKGVYLFLNNRIKSEHISRQQAWRIVKEAAAYAGSSDFIACHSMRKTLGYHAWRNGISPVLIMNMYNHSSFNVTQRYLGIEQDEKDEIYKTIML